MGKTKRPSDLGTRAADVVDRAGERFSAARWSAGLGILSVSVLAGAALARARRRKR